MIVLCADVGTTRIKTALMDEAGNILALQTAAAENITGPNGQSEMNMEGLWALFCECARALRAQASDAFAGVRSVIIAGQGDGMWPIDDAGHPARNAVLWNDVRSRDILAEHKEPLEKIAGECHAVLPFPGGMLLILRYIRDTEPENYRRIAHALHCKDWLNYRLTGEITTDYSDASVGEIDIYTKKTARPLFDYLGLDANLIPEALPAWEVMGTVLPGSESGGRYEYVAGVVSDLESIPEGMVGWMLPDGEYAEAEATGLEGIGKACREIIDGWLPASGYRLVQSPMFASTAHPHPDSPEAVWRVNIPVVTVEELEKLKQWEI